MSPSPICYLGTETDGVRPDREVWEVAAIRVEPDGTEHEPLHLFLRAPDLTYAEPHGLRISGFYERHPLGRVLAGKEPLPGGPPELDPELAARTIAAYTHGAAIYGIVPSFDTEALTNLLRRHRITPAWHYHLHDVADIARGWLHAAGMSPGELPESSDELSRLFGVEPPGEQERHTALADAQWVRRWHTTLMSQHRRDTRPNIA